MVDPDDVSLLKEMQSTYANDVRAILDDPESLEALLVLKNKGWSSSRVHGAYSSLMRNKSEQ